MCRVGILGGRRRIGYTRKHPSRIQEEYHIQMWTISFLTFLFLVEIEYARETHCLLCFMDVHVSSI